MDVYLVLAGVVANKAEIRVNFNPLVVWVWHGGVIMALGGLIVMWPQSEKRRRQGGYVAELAPAAAVTTA
jgi:cytochrome c-type biogenesis protein CcmF